MAFSHLVEKLPPYVFAPIERRIESLRQKGETVYDLCRSDPVDLPPPEVNLALKKALSQPDAHFYPPYRGDGDLRRAFAGWWERRFSAKLGADEIHILEGSKEGLAHLGSVLLNPGDVCLVPDPCFPPYRISAKLAGAEIYNMPLTEDRGFLPDLGAIPHDILRRARLMYLNYPNNPTGAVAPRPFLEEVLAFARRHDIYVAYDQAYADLSTERTESLLALDGARDRVFEFFTFSKPYNMQGYRLGAVCAARPLIDAFSKLEDNITAGVFTPVQQAGMAALATWPDFPAEMTERYQRRLRTLSVGFAALGASVRVPPATVYLWLAAPDGGEGRFTERLMEDARIAVAPGSGFGPGGKDFIRVSATCTDADAEAVSTKLRSMAPAPVRP